jgi:DNA-binding response OmpR family regulator
VKVLLVSPDPQTLTMMQLVVSGIERRLGETLAFVRAADGVEGLEVARRERPDAVVADEIASRAGAFSLARDLRGAFEPYPGPIVILLERRQDAWLAEWSGADAWFVKPPDPFQVADRLVQLIIPRTEREPA